MDEKLLNQLRWVLMTDEEGWQTEFARAVEMVGGRRDGLVEITAFLEEKLPNAAEVYRERMEAMIFDLKTRLHQDTRVQDGLVELAAEFVRIDRDLHELQRRIADLQRRREEVEQRMVLVMQPGSARNVLGYRFERKEASTDFEVVDPALLPMELTTPAPDVPAIAAWIRMWGKAPTGVKLKTEHGALSVMQLG